MNQRLVEDGKEAMSRGDWMLALSLFDQSRRICIDEGWREGVHYADDMILDIYPMVKRQIDDSNRFKESAPSSVAKVLDSAKEEADGGTEESDTKPLAKVFDEDPSNRRLRRMLSADKEE